RAASEPLAQPAPGPVHVDAGMEHERHPELTESVSLLPGEDLGKLFIGESQPSAEHPHDLDGLRLAETESTGHAAPEGAAATHPDEDWIEVEEEVVEQAPVRDALAANTRFNADAEGIDDDIREIFLEEMQEEIDNLANAEKVWLADPAQTSSLVGIRRSFHTLKGSGRLVGAGVLGEFAWKVEDMLNRVLDNTIEPNQNVQDLVRHAIDALPQLLAALKGEATPNAPLSAIMHTAEQLAAGHPARLEDQAPRATETVTRTVIRRVPRASVEAEAVPQASLTDAVSAAAAPAQETREPGIVLSVMPPVDPVLLEILRSEVAQYLQTIRAAIQRSDHDLPISEELLRAVHTLHGAIAMVDIPLLTQLLSPLEGLFQRLRASGQALSAAGVRLLGQSVDVVDHVMSQFDAAEPRLPDANALTAQIVEMRDEYPESQVAHVVYESPVHGDVHGEDAHADPVREEERLVDDEEMAASTRSGEHEQTDTTIPPVDDRHADVAAEMAAALSAFEPVDSASEHAAAERAAAEQAAAEQAAAEQAAAEQAAAEQAAAEQAAAEQAAVEKAAAEQAAAEHAAAEQAAAERAAAEQVAAEHAAAEHAAAEQAAAVQDVSEETPEPAFALAGGGQIDADLLEVFVDEAREILDHADGVLAQWHAEPAELSCVGELQRDLHTLKGGARIAGLMPLGDLAHAIETVLEKPIRDAGKTGALISTLEASFDQLHALVQRVSK